MSSRTLVLARSLSTQLPIRTSSLKFQPPQHIAIEAHTCLGFFLLIVTLPTSSFEIKFFSNCFRPLSLALVKSSNCMKLTQCSTKEMSKSEQQQPMMRSFAVKLLHLTRIMLYCVYLALDQVHAIWCIS